MTGTEQLGRGGLRMPRIEERHLVLCWIVLVLSGIVFGSSFSLFKLAAGSSRNPLGLAFWYSFLSAALISIPVLVRGHWSWLRGRVIGFCLLWGLVSTTLPTVLFFSAARVLPAGVLALAIAFVPIATFAGAIMLKRDQASFRRCSGLGLGAMAALLVILPYARLPALEDVVWVLLPFGAVLCFAAEHLYYAIKAPDDAPVDGLLFVMFTCAALTLAPVLLLSSTFFLPNWPPAGGEYALLGVAAVTVLDYFLFAFLIARAGPVFTSQAAYFVTLAGIGWGMLLFGESHSVWIWSALVLALVGVFLVQPREAGS
ncbi:MAG: DMT family transporter [Gammaproteobacteria bacterium]|nr:DMT family transporter [Gammaproteobacteria bacterium]